MTVRKGFPYKQYSLAIISDPCEVVLLWGVGRGCIVSNPIPFNSLEILLSMPVWRMMPLGAILIGVMSQSARWRMVSGIQSHCLTWCGENIRPINLSALHSAAKTLNLGIKSALVLRPMPRNLTTRSFSSELWKFWKVSSLSENSSV